MTTEITTRDFEGYKVSDSYVATVKTRDGEKQINLQEVMAVRLAFSTADKVFGWHVTDKQIADAKSEGKELSSVRHYFDLPYGRIEDCYASDSWTDAKSNFVSLNSLEVEDAKKLTGASRAKSTGDSDSKITFNTMHAKNLGNAILDAVKSQDLSDVAIGVDFDTSNKSMADFVSSIEITCEDAAAKLSAFDANSESNANLEIVKSAIDAFVVSLWQGIAQRKIVSETARIMQAEIEREQRLQEIREDAISMLSITGNDDPTDNQIAAMVKQLEKLANRYSK